MPKTPKSAKPIKDMKDFEIVEVFSQKPLTGADPVLLDLIKKAASK